MSTRFTAARGRAATRALGYMAALIIALFHTATQAAAQTPLGGETTPLGLGPPPRSERPYRGLFGGGVGESDQRLMVEVAFGGGSRGGKPTEDASSSSLSVADHRNRGGTSGTGSAKVNYALSRPRFGMYASNTALMEYYPGVDVQKMLARDIASFAAYFLPFRQTRVTLTQGFKDFPEFSLSDFYGPELDTIVAPQQDVGVTAERFRRFGTTMEVSHTLSRRSRADMSVGWAYGTVTSGLNWTSLRYSGTFNQRITRGVGLYAGYVHGEQRTRDANTESLDRHPTVNFGVDFNRALSFARRMTLSFSTGVSQIRDRAEDRTNHYLVGSAALRREFGRTWYAALTYNRSVRYMETLAVPLLADSVGVVVSGSFGNRLQFRSAGGAMAGQFGATSSSGFDTYFASAQLSMALNRHLALGTDYAYYRMAGNIPVRSPAEYPQSIRAYLQAWLPLLHRTRRPDASR